MEIEISKAKHFCFWPCFFNPNCFNGTKGLLLLEPFQQLRHSSFGDHERH
jgi:hypothetical protein